MNNNDIFKDLFVLEMTNNHLGSLERGMKIVDEFAKVAMLSNLLILDHLEFLVTYCPRWYYGKLRNSFY